MINSYTNEDYAKSYTELIEILRYIPKSDLNKIPQEKLNYYLKKQDNNYNFIYDRQKKIDEQNISHLTKILIANLYIQYWADQEEKRQIIEREKYELYHLELKKKEKYPTENLFKSKENQKAIDRATKSMVIVAKKKLIDRIIDKIKHSLKGKF